MNKLLVLFFIFTSSFNAKTCKNYNDFMESIRAKLPEKSDWELLANVNNMPRNMTSFFHRLNLRARPYDIRGSPSLEKEVLDHIELLKSLTDKVDESV